MPTSYPGALDTLTNPAASDPRTSPSHAAQHGTANDAIEALETKLGTGSSTPTTAGHVLKVTGTGATQYASPDAIGCGLYHNTTQSLTASSETALAFNSEDWDSSSFHDTVTNNTRVTVPSGLGGKYRFRAFAYSGITDLKQIRFRKNGTTFIRGTNVIATVPSLESSVTCVLAAGDYIEALITAGTTANVGHASAVEAQTTMTVEYLGV